MSAGSVLSWLSSFKRPLFACAIVLSILGSVALYAHFVESLPPLPRAGDVLEPAKGKFDVEITLTFDAQADSAFVLEPTSVLVSLGGKELINTSQTFRAGQPVVIQDVPNVKTGENEFWVEVHCGETSDELSDAFSLGNSNSSRNATTPVARAVRVRVFRDGVPVAEQTLWSEPGQPVEGRMTVTVESDNG